MWLTFNPQPSAPSATQLPNWLLEKVGQPLHPADVVPGGNRNMHAVSADQSHPVHYTDPAGSFELISRDAPVIALGPRTPLCFSNTLPTAAEGIHINLYNNAWGTNYPQWCGGDWLFRFTLHL